MLNILVFLDKVVDEGNNIYPSVVQQINGLIKENVESCIYLFTNQEIKYPEVFLQKQLVSASTVKVCKDTKFRENETQNIHELIKYYKLQNQVCTIVNSREKYNVWKNSSTKTLNGKIGEYYTEESSLNTLSHILKKHLKPKKPAPKSNPPTPTYWGEVSSGFSSVANSSLKWSNINFDSDNTVTVTGQQGPQDAFAKVGPYEEESKYKNSISYEDYKKVQEYLVSQDASIRNGIQDLQNKKTFDEVYEMVKAAKIFENGTK